jgi:Predicted transcriptional regulators
MKISEGIKEILNARNLTQSDLARMIGYTPQYIHEILSGRKRWNETTLIKACDALGLVIDIVEFKHDSSRGTVACNVSHDR